MLACELLIVISQTGWCIFKTVKTLSQFAPHLVLPCRPFITLRQCVQHKQTPPPTHRHTHRHTHRQTHTHRQIHTHTHTQPGHYCVLACLCCSILQRSSFVTSCEADENSTAPSAFTQRRALQAVESGVAAVGVSADEWTAITNVRLQHASARVCVGFGRAGMRGGREEERSKRL